MMKTKRERQLVDQRHRRLLYARMRRALLAALGDCCACCGSQEQLEIDHINGREWTPSKVGFVQRLRIYRQEMKEGKLQVLCKPCNQFRWPAVTGDARPAREELRQWQGAGNNNSMKLEGYQSDEIETDEVLEPAALLVEPGMEPL